MIVGLILIANKNSKLDYLWKKEVVTKNQNSFIEKQSCQTNSTALKNT